MLHSHVVIDQVSKFSKGYGFVLYSNHEEARHAISELNGLTIRDKILKVSFARPASEDIQDSKIHVSNIPPFLEEEALISVFKSVSCIVMYFPSWWWALHCYSNTVPAICHTVWRDHRMQRFERKPRRGLHPVLQPD